MSAVLATSDMNDTSICKGPCRTPTSQKGQVQGYPCSTGLVLRGIKTSRGESPTIPMLGVGTGRPSSNIVSCDKRGTSRGPMGVPVMKNTKEAQDLATRSTLDIGPVSIHRFPAQRNTETGIRRMADPG